MTEVQHIDRRALLLTGEEVRLARIERRDERIVAVTTVGERITPDSILRFES